MGAKRENGHIQEFGSLCTKKLFYLYLLTKAIPLSFIHIMHHNILSLLLNPISPSPSPLRNQLPIHTLKSTQKQRRKQSGEQDNISL